MTVTLVQGGVQQSIKKTKRKIEYVETRLLEVKLLIIDLDAVASCQQTCKTPIVNSYYYVLKIC